MFTFTHTTETLLKDYSTLGIGGPARYFSKAYTGIELQQMVQEAHRAQIPLFILGKGSNILFDDRGFDGLVVLNRIDYLYLCVEERNEPNTQVYRAGSGYSFARLGRLSMRHGDHGLEFAAGIPATVGGAVYMNAGAYDQCVADTLQQTTYLTPEGACHTMATNKEEFGYRTTPFQSNKGIIIEARFHLAHADLSTIKYAQLLKERLRTQPYKEKSAGCIFRNPYPLSAGALIDACGLKGTNVGGASISTTHANFIVNQGEAKAHDVIRLIEHIKEAVYHKKNVVLAEEIEFLPHDGRL